MKLFKKIFNSIVLFFFVLAIFFVSYFIFSDQFVKQEDGSYTAKLIGASGECKLASGDFLWCPMTDARFCTGLSDCDGTSGVKGVLADGKAIKVVEITEDMLPVDKEWHTVKFINAFDAENPVQISASYVELDQAVVKPADLQREGYNFLGWYETVDGVEVKVETISNSHYNLIAKWKIKSYIINYDLDGGEFLFDYPDNYTIESETLTIPTPEKDGYEFLGWTLSSDKKVLTKEITANETDTITVKENSILTVIMK